MLVILLSILSADTNALIAPPSLIKYDAYTHDNFPLPPSVRTLQLFGTDILPSNISWNNVTSLELNDVMIEGCSFPPNLTNLNISGVVPVYLDNLPLTLKTVTFSEQCNQRIDDLPRSVTKLIIGHDFTQVLDDLPPFLTHLEIGNAFNHPLSSPLPSLQYLKIGNSFNHPLNNLSPSLQTLDIGSSFNHPITIPPSLTSLTISESFSKKPTNFPSPLLSSLFLCRISRVEFSQIQSLLFPSPPNSPTTTNIVCTCRELKNFEFNLEASMQYIVSFNLKS